MVNKLIIKSQEEMKELVDEIEQLKKKVQSDNEDLKKKQKQLELAMQSAMFLGILNMGLSLAGRMSGAGAIFSQLGSASAQVSGQRNTLQMQELDNFMKHRCHPPVEELLAMAPTVPITFDPPSFASLEGRLKALKNHAPGGDIHDLEKRVKALNHDRKSDIGIEIAMAEHEAGEAELLKIQQLEVDLSKKERALTKEKVLQGMQVGADVAGVLLNGIMDIVNTQENYKSQIEVVKDAIKKNGHVIVRLTELATEMTKFSGSMQDGLTRLAGASYQDQNAFENAVSGLQLSRQLKAIKGKLSDCLSILQSHNPIIATLEDFEIIMETQIAIFEKIEAQKERLELADLMLHSRMPM